MKKLKAQEERPEMKNMLLALSRHQCLLVAPKVCRHLLDEDTRKQGVSSLAASCCIGISGAETLQVAMRSSQRPLPYIHGPKFKASHDHYPKTGVENSDQVMSRCSTQRTTIIWTTNLFGAPNPGFP